MNDDRRKKVATFYTHTGAMEFYNVCRSLGDEKAEMGPVPRRFSVSCGTGVVFYAPFEAEKMKNQDLEFVYVLANPEKEEYERIYENED